MGQNPPFKIIVFGIAILVAIINLVPIAIGYYNSTSDHIFLGFDFFDDFHNYSMYIYEAAHTDHLLLQNRNNTEFNDAPYIWPYFWILGKIVQFTGLPIAVVLMGSRAVISIALLLLIWKFITHIIENREHQLLAYALVALGTGIGWLVRLLQPVIPFLQRIKGADLDYTNGYSTFSGMFFPLQTLAMILLIASIISFLQYRETLQKKYAIRTAIFTLLIPFIHPPTLAPTGMIIGTTTLAYVFQNRSEFKKTLKKEFYAIAPYAIGALVFGIYLLWALGMPSYQGSFVTYLNWHRSDTPLVWPIGFGLLGLFALIGIMKLKFSNKYIPTLLLSWLGISLLLGLTGTGKKFLIGAHIPMAIIASFGVLWAFEKFINWNNINTIKKIALAVMLLLVLSLTHIVNIFDKTQQILTNPNSFMSKSELEAITFLEKQPPGNVLSSYRMGNNIIWKSLHRVYLGHWGETLNLKEKKKNLNRFLSSLEPLKWKNEFLKNTKINYIVYGTEEMQLGDLDNALPLQKIYENENVKVFKIIS